MQRAILLRFHKNLELIQNRIEVLKHFNPDTPIYGLFGVPAEEFTHFRNHLAGLEDLQLLDIEAQDTKWRFSDVGILRWFRNFGKSVNFDLLHIVEYDFVMLDTLENIYPYRTDDTHVYITNLLELEKVIPESNWFQNPDFPIAECNEFVRLMHEDYGLKQLYNSKAPGTALTRAYLEGYDKLNLPLIAFDEIRIPAIAQILSIEMRDTGFVKDWFDEESIDFRLFNTDNVEVRMDEMLEAARTGYLKAFHPVYRPLNL